MGIEALFDEQPDAEALTPEPETIVEPTPEPVAEEAAPEPEPVAEPEPKVDEPRHVPLATFLEMRDEAKELKRWKAEREAQEARPAPADMPDPIDDPQGFAGWQQEQVQQALVAQRFEISDLMAKQAHGEETVKAAADWAMERAQSDPAFKMAYMREAHPLDWIVREHKRVGLINEIGDNVDDWFSREAAKRGYAPSAPNAAPTPVVAAQAQPAPAVPSPPRSLASAPAMGGGAQAATGPMSALGAVFSR